MATIADIDLWVHNAAGNVRRFYPFAISNALGLPLNLVLDRLNYLVQGGSLILNYEIWCDDADLIKTVEDYKGYIGKSIYCQFCDCEVEIETENIYPVFYFNEEYWRTIKKKNLRPCKAQSEQVIAVR